MKLRITVNGKTYEVEAEIIEQDQPHRGPLPPVTHVSAAAAVAPVTHASPPAAAAPSATDTQIDDSSTFRSPISGVVVRVPVQVGQAVQANDELVVVEAMKMETILTAKSPGKVSKINIQAGDPVQVKQVLVEFE